MLNHNKLRENYKPTHIKYLFVLDALPYSDWAYFYDPENTDKDYYFKTFIQAIYSDEYGTDSSTYDRLDEEKPLLLERFRDDGFYIIEAFKQPFGKGVNNKMRCSILKKHIDELADEIRELCDDDTKVILLSKNLYVLWNEHYDMESFNIINRGIVARPGGQSKIRVITEVKKLLEM